jgi:hypothetical protein
VQVLDNLRHLRCTGWSCNACWLEITAWSLALVPQAMADICATLEAGGIEIESRISSAYQSDLTEYWST